MADLDHASDDDDAVSQLAGPSRLPAGRAASRRAGSRASSVASSTAAAGGPASRASHASSNGAGSSAATVAHGLPTSRPRARTSVSVTPEESGLPTSEATLESDTPAVAAYNSHAAARRNGASRTPPPRARAKPKRPALDPEAQKALERRRQKEEAEDDFFTRKPVLTFRTKKTASKADSSSTSMLPANDGPGPSRTSANNANASPPPSTTKGKAPAVVIDLDDDEDSAGSPVDDSDSEDAESDPYETRTPRANRKPKSKKARHKPLPDIRKMSPVKRPDPESDSSSSSSTYSFSSDTSVQRIKKDKHQGKKVKVADANTRPNRDRSLSPIEDLDFYVIQHAIQDHRRKASARPHPAHAEENKSGVTNGGDHMQGSAAAPVSHVDRHTRSPSAGSSGHLNPVPRAASFSLTPLPETKFQTEEEQEAKLGSVVSIKVEMVHDPRAETTDFNRDWIKQYESPVIVKTRQRETFHRLFDAISKYKSIPKESLTFTYNGKTVYKSGSPSAIQIISNATFKGYTKDVLSYVRLHPESILPGQESESGAVATAPYGSSSLSGDGHHPNGPASLPASMAAPTDTSASQVSALPQAAAANVEPDGLEPASLRLTIRGGPDQKTGLAVPPSKTVLSVIKHFLRKFEIDLAKAGQCKLMFDGEEILHDVRLGDTELEDQDTLDIKIPVA